MGRDHIHYLNFRSVITTGATIALSGSLLRFAYAVRGLYVGFTGGLNEYVIVRMFIDTDPEATTSAVDAGTEITLPESDEVGIICTGLTPPLPPMYHIISEKNTAVKFIITASTLGATRTVGLVVPIEYLEDKVYQV